MLEQGTKQAPDLTIADVKKEIARRALERQLQIQRGEADVPLHYTPLVLTPLLDLTGQLGYRQDFLDLAVPPAPPPPLGWLKSLVQRLVRRALRWVLIRQAEFNQVAVRHAAEATHILEACDRNLAELCAAMTALKLQVHALRQRLARLEGSAEAYASQPAVAEGQSRELAYQAYLEHLRDGDVLVLGCGRGDLVKLLLTEGVAVRGVELDREAATYCRERELPVAEGDPRQALAQAANGSLAGIYLGHLLEQTPEADRPGLLARAWLKLVKGGVLIAEASYPGPLTTELLDQLVEGQCFAVLDHVFSVPRVPDAAPIRRRGADGLFDQKHYRDCAVIVRK